MLPMALNALVHPLVTFVKIVLLRHLVRTSMRHVVIVANALLLLVPTAVSMEPSRQV